MTQLPDIPSASGLLYDIYKKVKQIVMARGFGVVSIALLVGIIMANIAWLLNPHACCPDVNKIDACEKCICNMMCQSVITDPAMGVIQTEPSNFLSKLQVKSNDPFSKGALGSVSNSCQIIAPVISQAGDRIIHLAAHQKDTELPESIVFPPLKKPPKI